MDPAIILIQNWVHKKQACITSELKVVEAPSAKPQLTPLSDLAKLAVSGGKFPTFRVVLSPLDVLRLSITTVCKACQTPISDDLR